MKHIWQGYARTKLKVLIEQVTVYSQGCSCINQPRVHSEDSAKTAWESDKYKVVSIIQGSKMLFEDF